MARVITYGTYDLFHVGRIGLKWYVQDLHIPLSVSCVWYHDRVKT